VKSRRYKSTDNKNHRRHLICFDTLFSTSLYLTCLSFDDSVLKVKKNVHIDHIVKKIKWKVSITYKKLRVENGAFDLKIYIITIYVRKQNYFNIQIYFKIIKYNMTLKYFHIQSNSWILQYSPKKLWARFKK